MKFGGTSVGDAACIQRAAAIVEQQRDRSAAVGAVVVVSAAAGVTRGLLELGAHAAARRHDAVRVEVDDLQARHHRMRRELGLDDAADGEVRRHLDERFAELDNVIGEVESAADYSPRRQDAVISFGERLSSVLLAAALRRTGLPVQQVAAQQIIVTDARFRAARPDKPAIERRARATVAAAVAAGDVVVTEGFIGSTVAGEVTTMGFEASDLSASLLGAALDAREVQIWTDVPGMLSTGHAAVAEPRLVPRLTFDEAAELALFGAKVLHPETVSPARDKGIPVRILHSRNPAGAGTLITGISGAAHPAGDARTVKSIAVTEDPQDESFAGVRATLRWEHAAGWQGRAIVCPVGEGIGSSEAIIEAALRALDGIPASLPLGRRPHAIPIAVSREQVADAVARLHEALIGIYSQLK